MHFTMQIGFRVSIPSIYQPHDLQHLHLPQFFCPEAITARQWIDRDLCEQALWVGQMSLSDPLANPIFCVGQVIEDLRDECSKHGAVQQVVVPRPTDPATSAAVCGQGTVGEVATNA